ncbi:MAG TPA: TonB family protein [Aliidongia sp.]|nr:TonB family protein [Aliidongia sp.]
MTMTADMAPAGRERLRWSASLVIALMLHASLALFILSWQEVIDPIEAPPPPPVLIDMAPLPVPPTPPQPPPQPQIEPIPDLVPAPTAAVALPIEKPKLKPRVKPIEHPQPVQQETAPATEAAPPAPAAPSAPTQADAPPVPAPPRPTNAMPSWQGLVLARFEQFKRYPHYAEQRGQQGVPYLSLVIDRQGKVLSFHIEKSSGFDSLDQEALALVERVQPLPPPPAEMPGTTLTLNVPIDFHMAGRKG